MAEKNLNVNIYTEELDNSIRYDGKDLGARCWDGGSVFKIWSPFAERVELCLYENAGSDLCKNYEMIRDGHGTWKFCTNENLNGVCYDYRVWNNSKAVSTADPYAAACSCNGKRSVAIDLTQTNPKGFEEDRAPARGTENIIYELHVKDFSYDEDSGIPRQYRGKFKAFTVEAAGKDYPTCMTYLKELGITHVHLLPIFDYGALDEAGDERQYNWGYDPVNYNIPEGSYSTDPCDAAVRIRECKEMIQALHKNGIRVVMDVVYNHTFQADSWLERMAPGYYNRRWADGSLSDGSACGNDLAAGRSMVDNYIVDSVLYWAREYHIDGFRFDLMGLLTVELMNRIRRELDREFGAGEKLLYGEPWRAKESPMEAGTRAALKDNVGYLDEGIAVFSDDTRDAIKGHVFFEEVPGFVNGGCNLEKKILGAVSGWRKNQEGFMPKSCAQVVNYVSAHDNLTLWDKLVLSMHGGRGKNNEYRENGQEASDESVFTARYEDVLKANKLAALIYFSCQGNLFMQAGEEFGRTKLGDHNSYRSAPEVNMLRWQRSVEYGELLEYYKGLIRLRKSLPGLYDKSTDAAKRIFEEKIHGAGTVSFRVDNSGGESSWQQLFVIYNAAKQDVSISLPNGAWTILADDGETDCHKAAELSESGGICIKAVSGMILGSSDALWHKENYSG